MTDVTDDNCGQGRSFEGFLHLIMIFCLPLM